MPIRPKLPSDPDADAIANGERALDLITDLRFIMRQMTLGNWPPSRVECFRRHLAEIIATLGPSE